MSTKACSKCGEVKPLSEFYKNAAASDGHQYLCKVCECARRRDYYQRNSDAAKLKSRAWELANPDRVAERRKKWVLANPDKRAEYQKKWELKYPGRFAEFTKKWRAENPERWAEIAKKWQQENADKLRCHQKLGYAVQKGWVLKSNTCQICGAADTKIEGHHPDYSKPLEVVWVCDPCHKYLHVQQRRNERTLERTSA